MILCNARSTILVDDQGHGWVLPILRFTTIVIIVIKIWRVEHKGVEAITGNKALKFSLCYFLQPTFDQFKISFDKG